MMADVHMLCHSTATLEQKRKVRVQTVVMLRRAQLECMRIDTTQSVQVNAHTHPLTEHIMCLFLAL